MILNHQITRFTDYSITKFMRVLVTGGTGYLGAAIVTALREAGHEPVVFARRPHPDARFDRGRYS